MVSIKVNSNDIIMTADTDLFPVGYDFLKPLGMHIKIPNCMNTKNLTR